MNIYLKITFAVFSILFIIFVIYLLLINHKNNSTTAPASNSPASVKPNTVSLPQEAKNNLLSKPIDVFENRITKKPFGIYITPNNSPVKPEIFTGYHTGVDVEYTDTENKIPVYSVSVAKVIYKGMVDGYGGVIAIKFNYEGKDYIALYGHLDLSESPDFESDINKGDFIGYLGESGSIETDGERKHLHFAIIKSTTIDFRGYTISDKQLSEIWVNPLEFKYN